MQAKTSLTDFKREEKFMETASVIILSLSLFVILVYILLNLFRGRWDYDACQHAFDQAFLENEYSRGG